MTILDPNAPAPAAAPVIPPSQADIDAANAKSIELQQQLDNQRDVNMQQLQDHNASLQQMQNARLQEQAPQPVTNPGLTAEDINEVMASGEGGEKILNGLNNMMDQRLQQITKEHIDPIRQGGTQAIATLALNQAKADPNLPHFARFEKDIKATLNQMPLGDRSNPDAIQLIYNNLVGQNHNVLMKESHEANLRKQEQDAATLQQSQVQGRQQQAQQQPQSLVESISPEAQAFSASRGRDISQLNQDDFARSSKGGGFADFADMQAFKSDTTENKSNYYAAKAKAAAVAAQGGAR